MYPNFPFLYTARDSKISMELKSRDLDSISSVLKHIYLPAVIGSLQNDTLLLWNSSFQRRVGLSRTNSPATA